ncbi:hypothetical protein ACPUEJ_24460 (plasmid) [Vibrio tubiashii]|uniref:hypothetical protein n=1 Tax=Vibrio tubiashii TaxID=29498 RepID=UPI003CE59EEF
MSKATHLERQSSGVQFLQDIIDRTNLALKVSSLSEQAYKSLVSDESRILDWLNHYPLFCLKERSFHIGLQRGEAHGDIMIGLYDSQTGKLHILLIEPLSKNAMSFSDRLMALVTYVALYFLTIYPESVGVYIVDPPKAFLSHYGLYGFKVLESEAVPVMFATFESLFERQQDFLFNMVLDEEVSL